MISPEYLARILDTLQTHKALQESIQRDMVRRIIKTDFTITDTSAWQAEKLQQSGVCFSDIVAEVAKETGKSKAEIKKAFADAKTEVFNYPDSVLGAAGIDPIAFKTISPQMFMIYSAALKKTTTEALNLTKTTATTTQAKFIQACDLAHMQVLSGAFSYQQAIKNAIIASAATDTTVIYPTGKICSLDAAVRRAVLTGVNQTCGKMQEMRAAEYAVDLMETSAHFGARPTHAEWQGQVVSLSGARGYLSPDDIGYGAVDGFMGANCRHDWHLYFEGASEPAYTPKQLSEFKNATVTYNGETIPAWEGISHQRSYERAIKRTKRELVGLDEAIKVTDDKVQQLELKQSFEKKAVRLKTQEAHLKDYCNQTGLRLDNFRMQQFAVKTEQGISNWGKSVSGKAVAANKNNQYDKALTKGINADKMNLDNKTVRYIYMRNVEQILNRIDTTKDLEHQAREAFNLRNKYRKNARLMMADIKTKNDLDLKRPNKTFDELLADKMRRKKMSREDAIIDILRTATKTNKGVNKLFE